MIYHHRTDCNMSVTPSRGLYLYLKTVEIAMQDAIVTNDEATILHVLANALGVSQVILRNAFPLLKAKRRIHLTTLLRIIRDIILGM